MKLLTWNINGRRGSLKFQVQFLAERCPDIVTLQEVTPQTGPRLLELLASQAGLKARATEPPARRTSDDQEVFTWRAARQPVSTGYT